MRVEVAKIPDFAPLLKEGMPTRTSLHKVIHSNPFTEKEILFLSNPSHVVHEEGAPIVLGDLIKFGEE